MVEASVLVELLAVVGDEDDERRAVEAMRPQPIEESPEGLVQDRDLAVVQPLREEDRTGSRSWPTTSSSVTGEEHAHGIAPFSLSVPIASQS